ncbi:MAG: ribosome biogenesis GTP-binding protein YihA/YsxC [Clostridiales bacterium]|nr:ribosome biogenesis GTP-binding protein YihA/YsxC [Bacillota bacterium]MCD8056648.1 ribosome biogenesis GTP-binding protein YihA/YsxC [Clostridiales bacterium]
MLNTNNAALKISAGRPDQLLRSQMPQAALSGRSNVGKSSLLNTLLGRKSLARVSSTPGKTVTVNYYDIDGKLLLVDLPGYGFAAKNRADRERWSSLVEGYLEKNPSADRLKLVIQLIDARIPPTADDLMMFSWLHECGIPYVVVMTKCDKCKKSELSAMTDALHTHPSIDAGVPIIQFSSVTGIGKRELWAAINEAAGIK